MADYEIELPWPPSVNGYWRSFQGRQIISKRGREYRKEATRLMSEYGLFGERVSGDLSVSIDLHPPTRRRYDIDNWIKAPFDALTHAEFWEDDEQVVSLSVRKREIIKPGKIIIKVNNVI